LSLELQIEIKYNESHRFLDNSFVWQQNWKEPSKTTNGEGKVMKRKPNRHSKAGIGTLINFTQL
jgi:hypothetical protein